jgi:hypothetical protein
MQRRAFMVGALALLAEPPAIEAQQSGKVWRIGSSGRPHAFVDALRAGFSNEADTRPTSGYIKKGVQYGTQTR